MVIDEFKKTELYKNQHPEEAPTQVDFKAKPGKVVIPAALQDLFEAQPEEPNTEPSQLQQNLIQLRTSLLELKAKLTSLQQKLGLLQTKLASQGH
jgi:hypothetical protein